MILRVSDLRCFLWFSGIGLFGMLQPISPNSSSKDLTNGYSYLLLYSLELNRKRYLGAGFRVGSHTGSAIGFSYWGLSKPFIRLSKPLMNRV